MEEGFKMWKEENGLWYYYKDGAKLYSQWLQDNNKWYYLDKDGRMVIGWFQTATNSNTWFYAKDNGEMATGWLQLNSKWYYLEEQSNGQQGECYINCTATIDGKTYSFDNNGVWIESLVSNECIDFVKSYEGFSATKYDDGTGVITQGYGMIGEEIANLPDSISEELAASMLKDLINNNYAKVIKNDLDSKSIVLKQYEFDALVSMSYNIGTSGMLGSTLYTRICSGVRDSSLESNFTAWSYGGGQVMQGLLNRRIEEYQMFINADYTRNL
jgi:lysozyme